LPINYSSLVHYIFFVNNFILPIRPRITFPPKCLNLQKTNIGMRIILLIGTGGFIGSVCRYLLSKAIQEKTLSIFPYGTLTVNLVGCVAIGLVLALSEKYHFTSERTLFLTTGICGGFTTFSAFSSETLSMLRDGNLLQASFYLIASIVFCLLATFLGFSIPKLIG
jgi:CrcB protein